MEWMWDGGICTRVSGEHEGGLAASFAMYINTTGNSHVGN